MKAKKKPEVLFTEKEDGTFEPKYVLFFDPCQLVLYEDVRIDLTDKGKAFIEEYERETH